ncbi:MAG TPA: hypothetical protein VLR89_08600 [Anaerolineaceae bacterium]|nr:hypothetical protein [Anaerolineaceae bacterium]
MNYSEVVSKAWQYVWKHKILWLFALFAGSIIGGATGTSSWSMGRSRANNQDQFWNRLPNSRSWSHGIETWFKSIPQETWIWIGIATFAVVLILSVLNLFVSTAGRAGLIKGLLLAEDRPAASHLSFKEIWQGMKPYYWRLLLLRLFLGVAGFALGISIMLIILFLTVISFGTILLLLIPLVLLIIPVNWLIQSVIVHATIALVDEDLDIFKAIKRGWEVVSKNIWAMLVIRLIVVLIGLATVIICLIPLGLASLPWIITLASGGVISTVGWIVGGILLGFAVLLTCFIGMWVNTLVHGIFVVMFRQLKGKGANSIPSFMGPIPPTAPAVPAQNEETQEGTESLPSA